jgi:putative tricarboxylic transport membrane protein
MELLMNSLYSLLTMEVFLALLLGIVSGLLIGALPGFSASMGVSMLLPVSFGMATIPALVMLTALYTSAIYGGSITAILIHTPGTPASGATADDGFALTIQGKGLQAIGVSTVCSCLGGFFSGLALIFIAPLLAKISLLFGPAEYFCVALFGLTIIGSLCSGGVVKGLLCAAFGLAVSCVGVSTSTQYPRFIYGVLELSGGLGIIPVLIGLFSISQIMIMAEDISVSDAGLVDKALAMLKGKIFLPLADWISFTIPVIRSTIIGTLIGILPGAGSDIAAWVAYNSGKQNSKHPELYGKGSYEGVACSEAANNAVCGGALIPLLTLSVPGSATAAIILGGFTMHGLIPGNALFTTHAGLTYPIMIGFAVSNILMGAVGLLLARFLVKITALPVSVLAPVIVVLASLGSYAVNLSMLDVWIMFVFGAIGYIMRKNDMIVAPIVLALILGPMAEAKLLLSFTAARSAPIYLYYLSRPICLFLIALTIISIVITVYKNKKTKKKPVQAINDDD